ncbi:uncharacterized protein METZ01_LOCUS215452, partial [marine metagenome]
IIGQALEFKGFEIHGGKHGLLLDIASADSKF